ncbi:tRNA (adenosine(37)-N6)-dimethylallyltransferase MiaA [Thermosipho ferrireducens]|uniref:tRNA dimethylallyltransferase n=1 Tax=Thermosipho ferrireducens TaxID=2571116 RepID=A0ABX7S6K8_9BACT|nr:tRNA (adenosine(37)-N6)-dimethylallyltransferase MiaA [Thermosipho ferrireducens]QTA37400.1 tRNA (adenosine(37)-N6)-dimethylallyltransferase MiaA [Thermosipho ferrireducens]
MKYLIISGPTGVGKTDLVIEFCQTKNSAVISVDSRQIYKYMDIGTAKPTVEERKKVPHYLIDFLDPSTDYNAFKYRQDALKIREKLIKNSIIPVFVGGTGLYIDALIKGLFEGVPRDENLRKELSELEKKQPGILRNMLEKFDPASAMKIHPSDLKRTIRALEVYMKTGKRISELQNQNKVSSEYFIVIFTRNRDELYERINERVEKMIEVGLLSEVSSLIKKYPKDINAFQTIGYKELIEYFEGKYNLEHAIHLIKRNTRRYARRQIIWLKRYKDALWLNLSELKRKDILQKLNEIYEKYSMRG